jgi:hypothetical protein
MNQVILSTETSPIIYDLKEDSFHTLTMTRFLIHSVKVGDNVNAYGNTYLYDDGINKMNYLHFEKGKTHILETPAMFLSFHIDKINKKI